MKTKILNIIESTWRPIAFMFASEPTQHVLRALGIQIPYRLAKYLNYRGLVKFVVNNKELVMRSYNTPIEITIFWRGVFNGRESAELRVWRDLLDDKSAVFDVGANNGVYSLLASAYTNQPIYAFEPVPAVRTMLEENITLSKIKNIHICTEVVSDECGQVTMYVPTDTGTWTDIASIDKSFVTIRSTSSREIICESITIDAFVSRKNIDHSVPLLLKIDVEGAETRVLKGMTDTLAKYQVVALVELLDTQAFEDFSQYLPESYKLYEVRNTGLADVPTKAYVNGVRNYVLKKTVN
jgi:FkbM family methyltransferase